MISALVRTTVDGVTADSIPVSVLIKYYKEQNNDYPPFYYQKDDKGNYVNQRFMSEIEDYFNKCEPLDILDIASISNEELKRVINEKYDIEELIKRAEKNKGVKIEHKLVDSKKLVMDNMWVDTEGNLVNNRVNDEYNLYSIYIPNYNPILRAVEEYTKEEFDKMSNTFYYVECFCTSTKRRYTINVIPNSIISNKYGLEQFSDRENVLDYLYKLTVEEEPVIDALDAIAWTYTFRTPIDNILYVLRQGDYIAAKVKDKSKKSSRDLHLKKEEYLNLIRYSS